MEMFVRGPVSVHVCVKTENSTKEVGSIHKRAAFIQNIKCSNISVKFLTGSRNKNNSDNHDDDKYERDCLKKLCKCAMSPPPPPHPAEFEDEKKLN